MGMQADIEIQSAAKLPTRHRRSVAGTGARSALQSGLCLTRARSAGPTAISGDAAARERRTSEVDMVDGVVTKVRTTGTIAAGFYRDVEAVVHEIRSPWTTRVRGATLAIKV